MNETENPIEEILAIEEARERAARATCPTERNIWRNHAEYLLGQITWLGCWQHIHQI